MGNRWGPQKNPENSTGLGNNRGLVIGSNFNRLGAFPRNHQPALFSRTPILSGRAEGRKSTLVTWGIV